MSGPVGTIVKLFILCVVVGLVMAWFNITPQNLVANFGQTVRDIVDWVVGSVRWAVPYAMLGAVIVLPVYGIYRINSFFAAQKIKKNRDIQS